MGSYRAVEISRKARLKRVSGKGARPTVQKKAKASRRDLLGTTIKSPKKPTPVLVCACLETRKGGKQKRETLNSDNNVAAKRPPISSGTEKVQRKTEPGRQQLQGESNQRGVEKGKYCRSQNVSFTTRGTPLHSRTKKNTKESVVLVG